MSRAIEEKEIDTLDKQIADIETQISMKEERLKELKGRLK